MWDVFLFTPTRCQNKNIAMIVNNSAIVNSGVTPVFCSHCNNNLDYLDFNSLVAFTLGLNFRIILMFFIEFFLFLETECIS